MPSSNIFHFILKKITIIKKIYQSVRNWSLALSTFPTLPDASYTLTVMSGCGTVLPPYTQYLYSDFYCLEHQLCWKDRTAWKRSCSPPGARSVKVEDQSRTHDTQPLGEILTAGYATRPGSWEPEGFLLPSWACSYSYPEQLAEVVLESGLCTWWQFTGLQMWSVGPLHKKIHLIFFMNHTASVVQGFLPLWQGQQGLGLASWHHVAPLPQAEQCLRHVVSSCSGEKRR